MKKKGRRSKAKFQLKLGTAAFTRRLFNLFKQPIFIFVTLLWHSVIAASAFSLYYLEVDVNPKIETLLDTFYWAVFTATTVGYGDITPVTQWGKVVAIVLMVGGVVLLWAYTALFVSALVAPELRNFESEVKELESSIEHMEREIHKV